MKVRDASKALKKAKKEGDVSNIDKLRLDLKKALQDKKARNAFFAKKRRRERKKTREAELISVDEG